MDERLGQIELLLKAQLDLAELLTLQPEARAEDYQDEPSVFQLNTLYEQVASAGAAIREQQARLQAARERLQSLDSRVRKPGRTGRRIKEEPSTARKPFRAPNSPPARFGNRCIWPPWS